MWKTSLAHTLIALLLQALFWPVLDIWSAIPGLMLYLGREVAQHEYKIALSRGWSWGPAKPIEWYEGLTKGWSKDSTLDIALPAIACGAVVLIVTLVR